MCTLTWQVTFFLARDCIANYCEAQSPAGTVPMSENSSGVDDPMRLLWGWMSICVRRLNGLTLCVLQDASGE